ncbi:MAG: HAD family acid phosphatase [Lachnospiraceae bacterium]|nr:HAD family acid phosphatase [Lachnospiraceae bacterium]
MEEKLILSTLPKSWIFDLDGTILKHNGYKLDGKDTLLHGAKEYLDAIPEEDKIIFFTSRTEEYRQMTVSFLKEHKIRFDEILFNMPTGERIVVNDRKPSGLDMAIAVNVDRDEFKMPEVTRML